MTFDSVFSHPVSCSCFNSSTAVCHTAIADPVVEVIDDNSDSTECDSCSELVDSDQIITTGDGYEICDNCLENYGFCDWSQEYYPADDLVQTGEVYRHLMPHRTGHSYCGVEQYWISQRYIDRHFSCCHDCEEYYHDDMVRTVYGNSICDECFNDNYFTCDTCNENHHTDQSSYNEDRGIDQCNSCYQESIPSINSDPNDYCYHVRNYSNSSDAVDLGFKGKAPDKLFYGIELETRSWSPDNLIHNAELICEDYVLKKFMILTEDGSIGKYDDNYCNFEIVTAPATISEHKKHWEKFFSLDFKGLTSWKSGSCGMHVHVSRNALSPLQIGKLVVFVNKSFNKDFITTIAGRYNNDYAKIKNKRLTDGVKHHSDRYEAINLTNDNTIEFRLFRGTLLKLHFYANLEFVAALVAYTNVCSHNDLNYVDFWSWVKEQPGKSYKNLIEFLHSKGF